MFSCEPVRINRFISGFVFLMAWLDLSLICSPINFHRPQPPKYSLLFVLLRVYPLLLTPNHPSFQPPILPTSHLPTRDSGLSPSSIMMARKPNVGFRSIKTKHSPSNLRALCAQRRRLSSLFGHLLFKHFLFHFHFLPSLSYSFRLICSASLAFIFFMFHKATYLLFSLSRYFFVFSVLCSPFRIICLLHLFLLVLDSSIASKSPNLFCFLLLSLFFLFFSPFSLFPLLSSPLFTIMSFSWQKCIILRYPPLTKESTRKKIWRRRRITLPSIVHPLVRFSLWNVFVFFLFFSFLFCFHCIFNSSSLLFITIFKSDLIAWLAFNFKSFKIVVSVFSFYFAFEIPLLHPVSSSLPLFLRIFCLVIIFFFFFIICRRTVDFRVHLKCRSSSLYFSSSYLIARFASPFSLS